MANEPSDRAVVATFRVSLLGPFVVERDAISLDARPWRHRVRSLFLLLATSPQRRRLRGEVVEIFWPDTDPDSGSANLRITAHRLRAALGGGSPSPVEAENGWIILSERYEWDIDLDRFQRLAHEAGDDVSRLEATLRLCQGEPLVQEQYEDWAIPIRERTRRTVRDVTLRLARLHRASGSHREAAQWLDRLLEIDPLDEEAMQELLAVLGAQEKRSEGLQRYGEFARRLADELGVPPDEATSETAARLKEGLDRMTINTSSVGVGAQVLPVLPSYPLSMPGPLRGRDTLLQLLLAALPDTAPTPLRLILLSGEAGIGKTRLLAEVAQQAREQGILVLAGGCYEREGRLPYGPIHDALADYVRSQALDLLHAQVDDLLTQLPLVVPELQMRLAAAVAVEGEEADGDRTRLFAAVAGFLERITAAVPVILLLDDLHWADEGTLQLVHYLIRHPSLQRLLLVSAYRGEEVEPRGALAGLESEAERLPAADCLVLEPLSRDDLSDLLDDWAGGHCSPGLAALMWQRTQGNPFFAQQMIRLLQQGERLVSTEKGWQITEGRTGNLPAAVRETVALRLRDLGLDQQDVLALGAVLGREFSYAALEALWVGVEETLLHALDAILRTRVLIETEDGYAFQHPLLHEVVYGGISRQRRKRLHRLAGQTLELQYGDQADRHAAELSAHFLAAGERERALHYALLAGHQAEASFAHEEAEQQYSTALELTSELPAEHPQRLRAEAEATEGLGAVLIAVSRYEEALPLEERAAWIYRSLGDLEGEGRAVVRMSRVWYHQHAEDEAVEVLRAMIAKLQGLRPSRILADLHEELAAHLLAVQRWTEALAALGRQEEMARVFGYERAVVVSQVMRGMLLEESGQVDEGLQMLERLLPALEKAGTPLDPDGALNHLRLWCLVRGDLRRSFGQVERRLAIHRRRRDPRSLTETLLDHGRMAFLRGSWDQAQVDFEEALEALADYPEPMLRAYVLSALGMLRTLTGDRVGGAHHLERCRAEAPALMGQRYPYELTLVYDDMLNGRPAAARATLQEIRDDSRYRGPLETLMFPILAQTYLASGEPEGASRILDQAKERAHAEGSRLALLEILRVEAMLLTHVGQADEAMHAAEDALSEALIIGLPYHAARLLDVCAALHVDRGEAQRARERLNEALAFFRSLGARPDVERVERALAAVEETSRAR